MDLEIRELPGHDLRVLMPVPCEVIETTHRGRSLATIPFFRLTVTDESPVRALDTLADTLAEVFQCLEVAEVAGELTPELTGLLTEMRRFITAD